MADEAGWLIEMEEGGRIVYFGGSILAPTADPARAIRFARERDANRLLQSLVAGELAASAYARSADMPNPGKGWRRAKVSEHLWPDSVHAGRTE